MKHKLINHRKNIKKGKNTSTGKPISVNIINNLYKDFTIKTSWVREK